MTDSGPENAQDQSQDDDGQAAFDAPTAGPQERSTQPEVEGSIEPHKRISEAEPEELVNALRQVFNGNDAKSTDQRRPEESPSGAGSDLDQGHPKGGNSPREPEAKSGYTNPCALFADIFYGVLIAPRQTLLILSDRSKFPPTVANLFLTFVLVFVALALPAAIKVGLAGDPVEGTAKGMAFVLANLADWAVLAFILYYLSIWLRSNRCTLGNAFIATGWAYLPFAFFAPIACFKSALGDGFTAFACLPALWFIVLQWLAFQTSLRTTTIKLALIALVVPPVFCLVYLFWIGLAAISLLSTLLSHLT